MKPFAHAPLAGALLLLAATPAAAQVSPPLLRIDGETTIRALPARVWAALTTPAGLAGWIAPESRVELRIGGAYELYFFPDAEDRGMEGTKVLAFVPEELLVTSGEAPDTWSVWRLEPLPDGGTRVSFSGLGTSAEWAERLPYFRDATPGVLARLKEAVEGGSRP